MTHTTHDDAAVKAILADAQHILVIQSDRPDGDSIASALFVEDVLATMGKTVYLYCGVAVPEYLRFIEGWDRISNELPRNVDATILVDNAAIVLMDKFEANPDALFIKTKPFIIADHHTAVQSDIPYATHTISRDNYASAGELLYTVFLEFGYEVSLTAKKHVMQSILSDTMGLTNDLAGPRTYRLMADFIEAGVDRSELEEARRQLSKMDERVFRYKADLISRTELLLDNTLALCVITENESYDVGTLYNPGPLILSELLMVRDVRVAIALKTYHNRITAAIRTTHGTDIAHALAEKFGGGGHPYSAGFRIDSYSGDSTEIKRRIVSAVNELLQ
jgi:phosphoesterase RecJ-like protein